MENTENLYSIISRDIENAVRFYGVLEIMINIGIETPAQHCN